jgi:hypothetical protein
MFNNMDIFERFPIKEDRRTTTAEDDGNLILTATIRSGKEEKKNPNQTLDDGEMDYILHSAIDIEQKILLMADVLRIMSDRDDYSRPEFGEIERLIYEQAEGLRSLRRELRRRMSNPLSKEPIQRWTT